ncbi:MAG TPA: hypothetical protein VFE47_28335 [Tepidisphaeraceae bacterium]|jgi:hypothetical protein|nr:hypothetical protein [Tepidisphaeraceae bacterium]
MSYIKAMILLLIALWGVVAWEALRHTPAPATMMISTPAVVEPPDFRPILDRRIGNLMLTDVDLEAAMQIIRRRANVNVIIRWQEIQDHARVARASRRRFAVDLPDATVETAMEAILESLHSRLVYGFTEGGTIIVTSDPVVSNTVSYELSVLPASQAEAMTRVQGYYSGETIDLAALSRAPATLVAYDVRDIAPNPPVPPPLPPLLPPPPVTSMFMSGYVPPYRSITVSAGQFELIGRLAEAVPIIPTDEQERDAHSVSGAPCMYAGRIVTLLTPGDDQRLRELLARIRAGNPPLAVP